MKNFFTVGVVNVWNESAAPYCSLCIVLPHVCIPVCCRNSVWCCYTFLLLSKWPAWVQKLTHTEFMQNRWQSVQWLVSCGVTVSQFCTALCFWLLYVNCYDVAKVWINRCITTLYRRCVSRHASATLYQTHTHKWSTSLLLTHTQTSL